MKVLNKLTLINLRLNKKRTIATIIGVALAASLIFGVGLYASSYRESLIKNEINNYGDYHLVITNFPYNKIQTYDNNKDIKSTLILNHINSIIINQGYKERTIDILSFEDYNHYITLKKGDFPKKDNEIIIPANYSEASRLDLNDTLSLEDSTYTIVGIYSYSELLVSKDDRTYNIYTKYQYNPEGVSDFYITFKSPYNYYQNVEKLALKLGLTPYLDGNTERAYKNVIFHSNLLSLYGQMPNYGIYAILILSVMLLSTILALFCMFSIYNSFAISINERKKMFGMLSSVGSTKWQNFKSVFFEAFIISLIAIPLGFILSIMMVGLTMFIVNKILLEFTSLQFHLVIYPLFILIPLIFIIIMIYLSALFPAKRASEVTPIEAIRNSKDVKIRHNGHKVNKLFMKLWGIEGELARKNIKRNKRKYRITILSLVISMVLFITSANYINIMYGDLHYTDIGYDYDIGVWLANNDIKKEVIPQIEKFTSDLEIITTERIICPISPIDKNNYSTDYLNHNDGNGLTTLSVILLDDKTYHNYLKQLGLSKENPIFVNNYSYQDYKEKKYQISIFKNIPAINITFDDHSGNSKAINDIYITDKALIKELQDNSTLYVNKEVYDELYPISKNYMPTYMEVSNIQLFITTKDYKTFDKKMQKLLKDYSSDEIQYDNILLVKHQIKMQILAIKFTIYSIIFFITLIGITSVFNTINTSINLRRMEFAVLRSVGLSPKGFNKMMILESLILGFKALLYGIAISMGLIYVTSKIFALEDYLRKIKIPFPKDAIIIACIAILLIIFLTMFYSTRRIKKDNIMDEIREENI